MLRMKNPAISQATWTPNRAVTNKEMTSSATNRTQKAAKGDGPADQLGSLAKDAQLGARGLALVAGGGSRLMGEGAGAVDDPAETVGHGQEKETHPGDHDDRTDGGLQDRDELGCVQRVHAGASMGGPAQQDVDRILATTTLEGGRR